MTWSATGNDTKQTTGVIKSLTGASLESWYNYLKIYKPHVISTTIQTSKLIREKPPLLIF